MKYTLYIIISTQMDLFHGFFCKLDHRILTPPNMNTVVNYYCNHMKINHYQNYWKDFLISQNNKI